MFPERKGCWIQCRSEVIRIAVEIPRIFKLPGLAEIIGRVDHGPGGCGLERNDGVDRPAFQKLSRRLYSRNVVSRGKSETMPDIKAAVSVLRPDVPAVLGSTGSKLRSASLSAWRRCNRQQMTHRGSFVL